MSAPTAAQAMASAAARLRAAGVPDPARDARLLLAHAASVDASRVTLIAPEEIAPEIAERYENLIALRVVRVPVSHLVGQRAFYGRDFKVSRDVLDPRPETETLIELALSEPFERVLDLGTGSGCILVTLLAEQQDAHGVGLDLSEAACLQASANAVLHGVHARADIRKSDWFEAADGRFDLIVANPPYLAESEMAGVCARIAAARTRDGLDRRAGRAQRLPDDCIPGPGLSDRHRPCAGRNRLAAGRGGGSDFQSRRLGPGDVCCPIWTGATVSFGPIAPA